ncbi:hypothetical protein BS78_03G127800 [Paspalum vaginatum]|nr:hypothetical protein BS78_03G127800 [Paspalum vaginatum]
MATPKGKNILPAPPMNPPPRLGPFGELRGCDGDGCASARDTWPLHHVYRRGVACHRLCCTCILLSNRSLYCCCCLLLIPSESPSSYYDDGDPLVALPIPTVTCQVCRDSVAHLACLYPGDGAVFVCPPCRAAQMGRRFTYEAPRGEPLDVRAARVLVLGAKIALGLLRSNAAVARAEAERLAQEARAARTRAYHALSVALELDPDAEVPSWNVNVPAPQQASDNNLLAAPGQGSSEANVGMAMSPLAGLTIGTEGFKAVWMAPAEASASHAHAPPFALPLFDENEVTMTSLESASAGSSTPPPAPNLLGVKEMAMAAAEAARASPPALQTLALFPGAKMPPALQLFQDKIPDDDEEM